MGKNKTVYDEIKEAMKERSAMREKLAGNLSKAKADKKKADKAAAEALKSGNADTYTKAKADSRKAAEEIEFYNIQIKELDAAPLFADYVEKIAEIKKDQQEKIDRINEKATKAMKEINAMIDEFYADFDETNKALEIAHFNTGFTFRATIPLHIKGIYSSTESVRINPVLSRFW